MYPNCLDIQDTWRYICIRKRFLGVFMNKNLTKVLASLTIAAGAGMFTACGDSDKAAGITVEDAGIADNNISSSGKVKGVSQKGPFLVGSTITLHEIDDETFGTSGRSFPDKIKNDKGEFEISYKELSSQYALLVADGYYRNENTGKKSTAPIKLNALSDLSDRKTVNVNLLTHLEYDRVKYLITEKGMEYKDAKAQAEKEILNAFGISEIKDASAEDLSIFGTTKNDGALLALSILMQGSSSEAEFSERLALIAQDLEKDGTIDDEQILADIADEALWLDLSKIKKNILDWKFATEIPDFEGIVTSYWTENYEIGNCTAENIGQNATVKNELSKKHDVTFLCDTKGWREITPDEVKYGNCSAAEENNRIEDVLVCHSGEWKDLVPEERVGECTAELYGEVLDYDNKLSIYNGMQFVCDADMWRQTSDEEKVTGVCVSGGKEVGKTYTNDKQKVYLLCTESGWRSFSQSEFEIVTTECEKDDKIVKSEYSDTYYICKDGELTIPSVYDFIDDKTFEANIWNGAKDSVAILDPSNELGYSSLITIGQIDGTSHSEMYTSSGNKVTDQYFVEFNSDGIAENLLKDKGARFTYKMEEKATFAYAQMGFYTAPKSVAEQSVDITDWEGVCIVYASTTTLELNINASNEKDFKFNYAKLPASMELTVANFKWEELNESPSSWVVDPLEAAKYSNAITVGPSFNDYYQSFSAKTGAFYIAGFGKYNGCSIK